MTTHNFVKQTILLVVLGVLATATAPAVERGKIFIGGRPTVISSSGSYVLGSSISLSENSIAAAGIMITADNVTLDLNGLRITGPGTLKGVGVMIDGASSVTVRNGHIADMAFGVHVAGSSNVRLNDLHISGQDLAVTAPPPEVGVMIAQSWNVEVEDVNISDVGLGVFVRGGMSSGNRIANNTVSAGSNGIFGICYNPTPSDPMGPRGDTVTGNLLSGFNVGVNLVPTAGYNVSGGTRSCSRARPGSRRIKPTCSRTTLRCLCLNRLRGTNRPDRSIRGRACFFLSRISNLNPASRPCSGRRLLYS